MEGLGVASLLRATEIQEEHRVARLDKPHTSHVGYSNIYLLERSVGIHPFPYLYY